MARKNSAVEPDRPNEKPDLKLLLQVLTAFKKGDFSARMPVEYVGMWGKIADTLNDILDLGERSCAELQRVAAAVGKEGKWSQRGALPGAAGSWASYITCTNELIVDLAQPATEMARVITAVANGDLSRKMSLEIEGRPLIGEFLRTANTVNTMVDQLGTFSAEVTRMAREVGTDGKLGSQAEVQGVAGTWKDLTDSINTMAGNLTEQLRDVFKVANAVVNGDLTQKMTVEARGEILRIKETKNRMVDQLSAFATEVTRVAREVGTEGKLGGQAQVKGVAGTWKDLTDNVNAMAANLTIQLRDVSKVATAIANGDLTQKITVDVKGEILQTKDVINRMVDQLGTFAVEVTRVAREVGTEGRLGGQAEVRGVAGTWKDLTENVNAMAANLTVQLRDVSKVATAIANGDLTQKITVDVKGEILQIKDVINKMVDQLGTFAVEVTRVAREVGTEGMLGGQALVPGVAGTWKDLTESVNAMAGNLTVQLRDVSKVATAIAKGDLSQKITVDVKGEILQIKETTNTMVDQLGRFASEVTRVAREVGTEGRLGGQADVKDVAGTWKDLTESVNAMAGNLTVQLRDVSKVATAIARGDLSQKITVDVRGEILAIKETINTMVDQLGAFASEVTRVAREVGTDGKLGGQADVKGISGTWKDLTDSVNQMAGNLTAQVRNIADVAMAIAKGDLNRKITVDVRGEFLQLKETINTMVDQLNNFAGEVTRVAREVGTDGQLGGQAVVRGVAGTWKDLTDNVNLMTGNLTVQLRDVSKVATAIANGDLNKKITVDVKGEILAIKETINTMVDQLNAFSGEVTRVAREVGTDGKLGGQAVVRGVAGTWKDLTDSVNQMAGNLTAQVRGIAKVVTSVANGNLKQKLFVEARGEILELADTINGMIDTLATFADQVTGVAREVGVEGVLGGQASVPGAAGLWRDLTDNVNRLAANLSTQVRAIAEVATAVTKGDLTRSITVEAAGEVELLKNNINEMIRNLRETTRANSEQDWLKSNLTKFTRMLQGQRDVMNVTQSLLSELASLVSSQHGVFYVMDSNDGASRLKMLGSYGYKERKHVSREWRIGEGLVGQCAFEKQRILLTSVPGDYVQIASGLGEASPLNIVVLPVLFEGQVKAVMELASFERFSPIHLTFLEQLTESLGIVLNTIEATSRTEDLLKQSQTMAEELQTQQEELQQTNEELEEKAKLLAGQNQEVERKNREIDEARQAIEEKAEQLALTSKYKSEFLANMSHELRTPLNSLMILSQQLAENPEENLTEKQVDFASTIHSSGEDLLNLINDILDLSKIESGTVSVDLEEIPFGELQAHAERTFRHVADNKTLDFEISLSPSLPEGIHTDSKRLQQILKNLLSNAFKFTEKGKVSLGIDEAESGWSRDHDILSRAKSVISFTVSDTGIGIPMEKQKIIFEAFQQADGSTNRKYGGTGLGLAISREIAHLLGGEIRLTSTQGKGSAFTLYLPGRYIGPYGGLAGPVSAGPAPPAAPPASPSARFQGRSPEAAAFRGLSGKVQDDRDSFEEGDQVVLIVEDDPKFAPILLDAARKKGLKGVITGYGEEVLKLVEKFKPAAVTLDIHLPDIDGWTILDRLKLNPETRHIPVHVISVEDDRMHAMERGAFACLKKPVTRQKLEKAFSQIKDFSRSPARKLLVVEDNEAERKGIVSLIGNGDIETRAVGTGREALDLLRAETFHCMILDLMLPDISGFEVLEEIQKRPELRELPVIVYTARDLTKKEETQLRKVAQSIIVKEVKSQDRLLAETTLFLHRVATRLPESKRKLLEGIYQSDRSLEGKKVLIVDDDVRNLFALTSILERHQMAILTAENGREGIEALKKDADTALVLMDIMMPEMDGYETIRQIRRIPQFKSIPILALTAKAMKGDREKCLEAGASDYITKPVNAEQLLSLMRVWMHR